MRLGVCDVLGDWVPLGDCVPLGDRDWERVPEVLGVWVWLEDCVIVGVWVNVGLDDCVVLADPVPVELVVWLRVSDCDGVDDPVCVLD